MGRVSIYKEFVYTAAQLNAAVADGSALVGFVPILPAEVTAREGARAPRELRAMFVYEGAACSANTVTVTIRFYAKYHQTNPNPASVGALFRKLINCMRTDQNAWQVSFVQALGTDVVTLSIADGSEMVRLGDTSQAAIGNALPPVLGFDMQKSGVGNITAGTYRLIIWGVD